MSSTQNQYSKENNFPGDQNLIKSDIEAKDHDKPNQSIRNSISSMNIEHEKASIMFRKDEMQQMHQSEMVHSPQSISDSSNHSKDQHELMTMLTTDSGSNFAITNVPILDVHKGRPMRLQVKVVVPVNDHPNYNFIGKLLGPKGNSLKWLQEQTQTKMAILGRGSMRDKQKEEDLRKLGDPKYSHLNEDLYVEITAFAPAPEAYTRIGHALHEVKRFLVPDYYDEIRQQQLTELGILNADKRGKSRINEPLNVASIREVDHTAIHQTSPNIASKVPPPHLIIPHSNGYSDDQFSYCINAENDSELSHYFNWEKKPSLKISSKLSKGSFYHEKPYSRFYNMYH